jgi:hypothetical protein
MAYNMTDGHRVQVCVDAVVNGEFSLHAEGFYVTEGQAVIILLGRCGDYAAAKMDCRARAVSAAASC